MTYEFSREEWETCIKVLNHLKNDPFNNPDNELFSGLIRKIAKNAKKERNKPVLTKAREEDVATLRSSVIAQNAINNTALFDDSLKEKQPYKRLNRPKNCYACHAAYRDVHFFYSRMCPTCAEDNYDHRFRTIDLSGRIALVTGGRIKVGYATALKLLRAGALVLVTTRFPALAYDTFQTEDDFDQWKDRLNIYGLDLKNLNAVQDFVAFYKSEYKVLDILINNAAQTIKYTDDYYRPLVQKEQALLPAHTGPYLIENQTPVLQSQRHLGEHKDFQDFALNRFGQPVDTRDKNSWNATLEEVSLYELLEASLINQISPYTLIKELKLHLDASKYERKFIINVTSSEGQFSYKNKTCSHPHTNMTKAALNMLTRTSAQEYVLDDIYMYAVDVGWISTGATEPTRQAQFERGYIPPLDPVDGAARILHPIISGIRNKPMNVGVLLKNYEVSDW